MDAYRHTHGKLLPLARRWEHDADHTSPTALFWIAEFAAMMLEGVCFPPITVVIGRDGCFGICDGHHRAAASLLAGFSLIPTIDCTKKGSIMTDTDARQVNGEEVQQQPEATERPRLSLERRVGVALANNGINTSSDEIRMLIEEVETAAAEATVLAQEFKRASLDVDNDDPLTADRQHRELAIHRERLLITIPHLRKRLATVVSLENTDRYVADRNKVAARRDDAAKQFCEIRDIFDDLVDLFSLVAEVDAEVNRVNASNPTGGEPLATVECYARRIDAFSRSQPSIVANTQLPDWSDSQRLLWPPPRTPMSVLVAGAMSSSPDPRYTDNWAAAYEERRAEQEAEAARTAAYYAEQHRAREEREAKNTRALPKNVPGQASERQLPDG
jgi:hypothetical protein